MLFLQRKRKSLSLHNEDRGTSKSKAVANPQGLAPIFLNKYPRQPLSETTSNKRQLVLKHVAIPVYRNQEQLLAQTPPASPPRRHESGSDDEIVFKPSPKICRVIIPAIKGTSTPPTSASSASTPQRQSQRAAKRVSYAAQVDLDDASSAGESEQELLKTDVVSQGAKKNKKRSVSGWLESEDEEFALSGDSESASQASEAEVLESESDSEDVSEVSDDDAEVIGSKRSKGKPASQRTKKTAVTKSSEASKAAKNGAPSGKTTSNDMEKLLTRKGNMIKGLDSSLPPLFKIDEIFADITRKGLALGLDKALQTLDSQPIRVATMCSGTESPLLALQMIQDALKRASAGTLHVDHLFSAEIVPFKQAYIERNFNPPIIFRDITELTDAVHEDVPMATTAYGARVEIPTDVHIVIAGTSCVDFSRLNRNKKGLSDGGESDKTWHAVLAFCKAFRPPIVLLENVRNAHWDLMLEHYEEIGYESAGVLVDTKDYYIPHTRQRGYMACFDKGRLESAGVKNAGDKWKKLMDSFKRYASSPVSSFLLPNDKVTIREQSRGDEHMRVVDWARCEVTQMQYRQDKRLGNARPWTNWQESGAMLIPENGALPWYSGQVERVLDTLDVCLLRKALISRMDVRFKTRIWDLSQNVYYQEDNTAFGITSCITPSGQFFISDSGRQLAPEENLILQGLPLDAISFTTETPAELQDLAGNAMSSTVIGSAILSALIAGGKVVLDSEDRTSLLMDLDQQPTVVDNLVMGQQTADSYHTGEEHLNVRKLISRASKTLRRCFCEGSHGIAEKTLQQCIDCGHSTCIGCGGNPPHSYRQNIKLTQDRIYPGNFEAELRNDLPLLVRFGDVGELRAYFGSKLSGNDLKYAELVDEAAKAVFSLSHFRRTHCLNVVYQSGFGRVELTIEEGSAEWRFYVDAPKDVAVKHPLREMLQQPVAKSRLSESLFTSGWTWRAPKKVTTKANIIASGSEMPSWWNKMDLPDFKDHHQREFLEIESDGVDDLFEQPISGRYQYLPKCGTSCDSLYRRVDSDDSKTMFLFHDPTRTGPSEADTFVFSTNKASLEYDEVRSTVAYIEAPWGPWDDKSRSTATISCNGEWIELPGMQGRLRPDVSKLEIHNPTNLSAMVNVAKCHYASVIAGCSFILDEINGVKMGTTMIKLDDRRFFSRFAWAFEAMRRQLSTEDWRKVKDIPAIDCKTCAPPKPVLRWKLADDGLSVIPYEDASTAASYERAIKSRPEPLRVRTTLDSSGRLDISFAVNFATLAHRARSRLPGGTDDVTLQWKFTTVADSTGFTFKPFKLHSTKNVDSYDREVFKQTTLFPKQRTALAWMRSQEAGDGRQFMLEEAEEAALPELHWRVEMRAQAYVNVRGGICADHPGFGKTITSLALVQSQLQEFSPSEICSQMQARLEKNAPGLIPLAATLIVCPGVLLKQWIAEIFDKLRYNNNDVISINSIADLKSQKISDFRGAKIILVNRQLFGSEAYVERLAALAAVPGPAVKSGRALTQWIKYASAQIPEHIEILHDKGRKELQRHIKKLYIERLESDDFKAAVPSRRLRGAAYIAAQPKKDDKKQPLSAKAASRQIDTESVGTPLFEMFYFNRLIVDEFHQYEAKEYAAIASLRADKRWGLSATPALGDFYDIAQMAGLLGVQLRIGSDTRGIMRLKNMRSLRSEMTDFERFDSMRQAPSSSLHSRLYEQDQLFLNTFVRRNIMDFEELKYRDNLVPVTLDLDHRAIYTELSQHLNSLDMRIKKGNKNKNTDRDERLTAAAVGSETAEEALSKTAAYYDHDGGSNGRDGMAALVDIRRAEIEKIKGKLKQAARAAMEREQESFTAWQAARLEGNVLGDEETIVIVKKICKEYGSKGGSTSGKPKKNKDGDVDDDSDVSDRTGKRGAESKRAMTSDVNTHAVRLLVAMRSLRYLNNILLMKSAVNGQERMPQTCDHPACSESLSTNSNLAVSSLCGHMVCQPCYERMQSLHTSQCSTRGCSAGMRDHHLLWREKMGDLKAPKVTPYGAKIEAAMDLLEQIEEKDDQAILFVQYENQLKEVRQALLDREIASTVVINARDAGAQILSFRESATSGKSGSPSKTVLVLNASDETAAGSNLQNANHVLFLSPLLRDTQYAYDATMAQAIGRVRRHGQKKPIFVYRFVALDTIDVDILEHRERRCDAITQIDCAVVAAPTVSKSKAAMQVSGMEAMVSDEVVKERTQLVREAGVFSLRPMSWLVSNSLEEVDEEVEEERVKGRSRVQGWENFSSLVKFSRAYTEDDD